MIKKNRKKALVLAISSALWGTAVYAQEQTPTTADETTVDEVIVKGVRASQAKAIDIKRTNVNVVDSIVAEDIGKLPDATITDSLQRVTGVQIKREANEGTSLNVRGMPQVMTALNGEQFISPWNIASVGANYGDIPAGLINGVDVYKSQSASTLAGGISGMVDLKTISPLSLKSGWTGSLKLEGAEGDLTRKEHKGISAEDGSIAPSADGHRSPDSAINLFLGHNFDGAAAFTLSAFHSNSYAANYGVSSDINLAFLDQKNGNPSDPLDLDGNGDKTNDWYLMQSSYGATSSFMERKRDGGAFSIEFPIGDTLKFKGDVFYTKMDQRERGVQVTFATAESTTARDQPLLDDPDTAENEGTASTLFGVFDTLQKDGTTVGPGHSFTFTDLNGVSQTRTLHSVPIAHIKSDQYLSSTFSNSNQTEALNTNFQLNYDSGENLTGSVRYVYAKAARNQRNSTFQQGLPAWVVDTKTQNIPEYDFTVDYTGDVPSYTFPDGDKGLADPAKLMAYQPYASGEDSEASLNVLRIDAKYAFDNNDYLESVEGGFRLAVHDGDDQHFNYMTPTGRYSWWDPQITASKQGTLLPGNRVWQRWAGFRYFDYSKENETERKNGLVNPNFSNVPANNPWLKTFYDFGPIKGFEKGVASIDPKLLDNPLTFMKTFYPEVKTFTDPAFSYKVRETTASGFTQFNFGNDDTGLFGIPFKGNLGVKIIETDREITKTIVPDTLDNDNSVGDSFNRVAFVTETETFNRSFTDVLPSANLNLFPTDDVIVRLGVAKTMTTNDLNNIGSDLTYWTTDCPITELGNDGKRHAKLDENGKEVTVQCVAGGSDQGNVDIKPWRATVYNTAVEWYFDKNSILGVGVFMIDADSAVQSFQEQRHFVDLDGVDRGNIANVWATKNTGASKLYGLETGYKQPFTFLPGFLSSTGMEINYTYSQSESTDKDLYGNALPLQSNSKHQSNFILWYDKSGVNVRLAYNYRSKEYLSRAGVAYNGAILDMGKWAEPTGYLDLQVSYWVNEHLSMYVSGTNLTAQDRKSYSQFTEQFDALYVQERKYTAGVTLSF